MNKGLITVRQWKRWATAGGAARAAALAVALLMPPTSEATPRDHPLRSDLTIVDPSPWASNGTATAVAMAPAMLGSRPKPEFMYGRLAVRDGPFDGDDMYYLRGKRFGLGTEKVNLSRGALGADSLTSPSFRRYTFAFGSPSSPRKSFGVSYTYISSDNGDLDGLSSIDLGMSGRMSARYTFHFTARNVNRSRLDDSKLARFYEIGTRGVYFQKKLGLFAQWSVVEGEADDGGVAVFGSEYRRGSSMLFRGRADTEGNSALGTEYLFSSYSIGFHYLFDDDWESGLFTYVRIFAGS